MAPYAGRRGLLYGALARGAMVASTAPFPGAPYNSTYVEVLALPEMPAIHFPICSCPADATAPLAPPPLSSQIPLLNL